jgi:hypothetical protein
VTEQLTLTVDVGLCEYGGPKLGEPRLCTDPATHRAHWSIPATYPDGTPNSRAGAGGVDACLYHANYYATAWVVLNPLSTISPDAVWLEVLT